MNVSEITFRFLPPEYPGYVRLRAQCMVNHEIYSTEIRVPEDVPFKRIVDNLTRSMSEEVRKKVVEEWNL